MNEIKVAAAVIMNDGAVLCAKRGEHQYEYLANKYEFPGGKIETGETAVQALQRELVEELGLHVDTNRLIFLTSVEHKYPDFLITLLAYLCPVEDRRIVSNEHAECRWLKQENLDTLDWAEADTPVIAALQRVGYCASKDPGSNNTKNDSFTQNYIK